MMAASDSFALFLKQIEQDCAMSRRMSLLAAVGTAYSCYLAYKLVTVAGRAFYVHFSGIRGLRQRLIGYGRWAVITGCTSGVGREYACILASYGLDLVLIGRREKAVKELADELEENHGIRTIRVKVDFAGHYDYYDDVATAISDLDIGILVNNVGVMYDYPQYFSELSKEKLMELIRVNCVSATLMTHLVLPHMLHKRKGLVVFMGSNAAMFPTPLMSCYAATKKYINYFADCLSSEYSSRGIHVQCLKPFYIATKMTAYNRHLNTPSPLIPSAATYARHALWTFGVAHRTAGYMGHTLQEVFLSIVPEWLYVAVAYRLMQHFRSGSRQSLASAPLKRLPTSPQDGTNSNLE